MLTAKGMDRRGWSVGEGVSQGSAALGGQRASKASSVTAWEVGRLGGLGALGVGSLRALARAWLAGGLGQAPQVSRRVKQRQPAVPGQQRRQRNQHGMIEASSHSRPLHVWLDPSSPTADLTTIRSPPKLDSARTRWKCRMARRRARRGDGQLLLVHLSPVRSLQSPCMQALLTKLSPRPSACAVIATPRRGDTTPSECTFSTDRHGNSASDFRLASSG